MGPGWFWKAGVEVWEASGLLRILFFSGTERFWLGCLGLENLWG